MHSGRYLKSTNSVRLNPLRQGLDVAGGANSADAFNLPTEKERSCDNAKTKRSQLTWYSKASTYENVVAYIEAASFQRRSAFFQALLADKDHTVEWLGQ